MRGRSRSAVLVVDPSLRSGDGHHFSTVQRLRSELADLGLGSIVFSSAYLNDELRADREIVPVFDKSIYGRERWTYGEFQEFAQQFAEELEAALKARRLRPDIMVLPGGDQATTLGLASYFARHRFRSVPEVVIWLLMAPHFKKPIDDPTVAPLLEEYREAFAALLTAVGDARRIRVYCETKTMAEAYSRVIGLKVETARAPNLILKPRSRKARRPGEPMNIICAGNVNVAKGYFLLPDVIRGLAARRSDARFLIHGTVENTDDASGRDLLGRIAGLGADVVVRTDLLSAEDYAAWLAQADLLLLPYDPAVYRTRGSGIFTEAETLGIPIVAPAGCDFAKAAIAAGRAVGIEDHTAPAVVEALSDALNRLSDIERQADRFAAVESVDNAARKILEGAIAAAEKRTTWSRRILGRLAW